jgi:hypothetical protein
LRLSTILAQARKNCGEVLPKSRYRPEPEPMQRDPTGIIGARDDAFVARRDFLLAAAMTARVPVVSGCIS